MRRGFSNLSVLRRVQTQIADHGEADFPGFSVAAMACLCHPHLHLIPKIQEKNTEVSPYAPCSSYSVSAVFLLVEPFLFFFFFILTLAIVVTELSSYKLCICIYLVVASASRNFLR